MRCLPLLALLAMACAPKVPGTNSCTWLVECTAACSNDDCLNGCADLAAPAAISFYNARANCETDAGCVSPSCVQRKCASYRDACTAMDAGVSRDGGT
jgi:hypothetical protein